MHVLRLRPDRWTTLPGSRIQVLMTDGAEVDITQRPDGVWDLAPVPVLLLIRKVDSAGRPVTWPWPLTPLPYRG